MKSVNHVLISAFAAAFAAFLLFSSSCYAQEVKAQPVPAVQKEAVPVLGKAPVVVELFSSQACVFCPEADRLFADFLEQDNVIGLACHVDYFDVKQGSLAQPFCTERQDRYMETLGAGPNYTPQMVVNGVTDVVGYKLKDAVAALQKAAFSDVRTLRIAETTAAGTYKVSVPPDLLPGAATMKLWLALYDKPHDLTVAEGRNKGQKSVYAHVVSSLGATDKITPDIYVTPPLEDRHAGFAVILQDTQTGRIYGAGERRRVATEP